MKSGLFNKVWTATAVAIIVAGGIWWAFVRNNDSTTTVPSTSASTAKTQARPAPPATADKVTIKDTAFSPQAILIKKGTTVTWTNKDTASHTVAESDGQTGPNSGTLDPGKTYSFTFNQVGYFNYQCTFHTNLTGTVIVTN